MSFGDGNQSVDPPLWSRLKHLCNLNYWMDCHECFCRDSWSPDLPCTTSRFTFVVLSELSQQLFNGFWNLLPTIKSTDFNYSESAEKEQAQPLNIVMDDFRTAAD